MYDVALQIKPQDLIGALIASGGAALSALAMACRHSGQRASKAIIPDGFPRDGGAYMENYIRAYLQLLTRAAYTDRSKASDAKTALEYALQFFDKSSIVVHRVAKDESTTKIGS